MDEIQDIIRSIFKWRINFGGLTIFRLPIYASEDDKMGWVVVKRFNYQEYVTAVDFISRGWWEAVHEYVIQNCIIHPTFLGDATLPPGISTLMIDDCGFDRLESNVTDIVDCVEYAPDKLTGGNVTGLLATRIGISVAELKALDAEECAGLMAAHSSNGQDNIEPRMTPEEIAGPASSQDISQFTSPDQMLPGIIAEAEVRGARLHSKLVKIKELQRRGVKARVPRADINKDKILLGHLGPLEDDADQAARGQFDK